MVYAIDEESAKWVEKIFAWYVYDRRSIRWITRELNHLAAPKDHRATTPYWHHQYVARLLTNPKYVGKWRWAQTKNVRNPLTGQVRQEDRAIEDQEKWERHFPHLQIIDDATFQQAQERSEKNAKTYAKNRNRDGTFFRGADANTHPRHLLSGTIECGECGATFYVGGTNAKYLYCPNYGRGLCRCQTQLQRQRAEQMILDEIGKQILGEPGWRQAVLNATQAAYSSQASYLPSELKSAESQLARIDSKITRLVDCIEDGDKSPEISQRLSERRQERRAIVQNVEKLHRKNQDQWPAPTQEWIEEQLGQLGSILRSKTPAANESLKKLVGGRIVVQEIRQEGRQRHHIRGTLRIDGGSVREAMGGPSLEPSSEEGNPANLVTEIVLDFVDPDPLAEKANHAKALEDQGLLGAQIAEILHCSRSNVTKLLKHWYVSRGLVKPDGRARRCQLQQKHLEPPLFQVIAEDVKQHADEGLSFGKIAEQLGVDRNTVTKAWAYWHVSRGLPVADGRTRRKTLKHKSLDCRQNPPKSEPDRPTT